MLQSANVFSGLLFRVRKESHPHTLLSADDLLAALSIGNDVDVMHVSDNGEHRWRLNWQEKGNLRELLVRDKPEAGDSGNSSIN